MTEQTDIDRIPNIAYMMRRSTYMSHSPNISPFDAYSVTMYIIF